MKRARGFIILATIATLALGSVAFGADTAAATTPTATEAAASAKTYANLSVKDVLFQNDRAENLGVYPEVAGMTELNEKISKKIFASFLDLGAVAQDDFSGNNYQVSYTVENTGRYAKLTVTRSYFYGYTNVHDTDATMMYYIDKETNKELTEAEYKTAMEAPAKPAEKPKEEKAEPVFVPLRDVAELLGYTLSSSGDNVIVIANGDFTTKVTIDTNKYMVKDENVELESAPFLFNERAYVPTSFFEKVLGATLSKNEEGIITIAKGDKKAEVKVLKELPKAPAKETTDPKQPAEMPKADPEYIPLRKHAEDLGFTLDVSMYATTKKITVTKGDVKAELTLDSNVYMLNGKEMKLDAAPVSKDGTTFAPLSFFTDVLGATAKTLDGGAVELTVGAK